MCEYPWLVRPWSLAVVLIGPACLSMDKVFWKAETESSQHSRGHGE